MTPEDRIKFQELLKTAAEVIGAHANMQAAQKHSKDVATVDYYRSMFGVALRNLDGAVQRGQA